MADEIETYSKLYLTKGGVSLPLERSGKFAQAGTGYVSGVLSVPTTAGGTAIPLGVVTTPGFALFTNLDTTNYVLVGKQVSAAFVDFLKVKPGETVGPVRLSTTAPYALANAGAVLLNYTILQD